MSILNYTDKIRQSGNMHFTIDMLTSDRGITKNAALNSVYRFRKKGKIISPLKGLYVIIPPEHMLKGCIPAEELIPIIMNHLDAKYYVALLSAASFYGANHQKVFKLQVVTNKRITHPLDFGQVKIEVIYKKDLYDVPTNDFAVNTGYLKVASPELVALDLLRFPHNSGGLNNIATIFSELVERIDAEKLLKLAINQGISYQIQRIGYILDNIDVMNDETRAKLVSELFGYVMENNPKYLLLTSKIHNNKFSVCRKWRIIINAKIESDL